MNLLLKFFIVGLLLFCTYQDFRHRAFNWLIIPCLALALGINQMMEIQNVALQVANTFTCLAFMAIQVVILGFYFACTRKQISAVAQFIGLGDVLFFGVICLSFSVINLAVFYLVSLFVALGIGAFLNIQKGRSKSSMALVPLAGIQAMMLCFLVIAQYFKWVNLFSDELYLSAYGG